LDKAIELEATLGLLLAVGVAVGLTDRKGFSVRWLLAPRCWWRSMIFC